jgi:hypothetical protein
MTVHDALDHPWLREDRPELDSRIPSSRFDNIRQRIRGRYVCLVRKIILKKLLLCTFRRDTLIQ